MSRPLRSTFRSAAGVLALLGAWLCMTIPASADCTRPGASDPNVVLRLLGPVGTLRVEGTKRDASTVRSAVVVAPGVIATPSKDLAEGGYTYLFDDGTGEDTGCYLVTQGVAQLSLLRCESSLHAPVERDDQPLAVGQRVVLTSDDGTQSADIASLDGNEAVIAVEAKPGTAAFGADGRLRGFVTPALPAKDAAGCPRAAISATSRWDDEIRDARRLPPTLRDSFLRLWGVRAAIFAVAFVPVVLWRLVRERRLSLSMLGLLLLPGVIAGVLTALQVTTFGVAGVRF